MYNRKKPVSRKGNQLWIFFGRTDAEVELQYFGHLMQRTDFNFLYMSYRSIARLWFHYAPNLLCDVGQDILCIPRCVSLWRNEQTELEWPANFLPLYILFIYKLHLSLNLPVFNFNISASRNFQSSSFLHKSRGFFKTKTSWQSVGVV